MAVEPLPGESQGPMARERLRVAWIVEETMSFYKKHFVSLFVVFLVANLIVWMVQFYSGAQVANILEKRDLNWTDVVEHPEESASLLVPLLVDLIVLFLLMMIVAYLVSLLFHGAAIRYVYDRLQGTDSDWPQCFSECLRKFPRLVGATIAAGLIVALGLLALVVPGLVVLMMFILVPQTVILEGKGLMGALSRSNQLTSGNKMVIFLFFLFWAVVLLLFYMIVEMIMPSRSLEVTEFVASALFAPVLPVATTLIYGRLSEQAV